MEALREKLRSGDKALVGNSGYREYLQNPRGGVFSIDEEKVAEESLFDGKWVLRTNSELSASEVALKYKQLWACVLQLPGIGGAQGTTGSVSTPGVEAGGEASDS